VNPGDAASTGTDPAAWVPLDLVLNRDRVRDAVPPHRTLLEFLRYDRGLTGSKQGCDKGDCGACTVLLDGVPILACITLAREANGARVDTVESLAEGAELHPLQEAFVRLGAAQCGFCTPGMLMSAKAFVDRRLAGETGNGSEGPPEPIREAIRLALSGNLCRCTGYTKILDAVEDAIRVLEARRAELPR